MRYKRSKRLHRTRRTSLVIHLVAQILSFIKCWAWCCCYWHPQWRTSISPWAPAEVPRRATWYKRVRFGRGGGDEHFMMLLKMATMMLMMLLMRVTWVASAREGDASSRSLTTAFRQDHYCTMMFTLFLPEGGIRFMNVSVVDHRIKQRQD